MVAASSSAAAKLAAKAGDVHTTLTFGQPAPDGAGLYFSSVNGVANPDTNTSHKEQEVVVRDLRSAPEEFSLLEAGFELTSLSVPDLQWTEEEKARPIQSPESCPPLRALLRMGYCVDGRTVTLLLAEHKHRSRRCEVNSLCQLSQ